MVAPSMAGNSRLEYEYWNNVNLTEFGSGLVRVSRDYYIDIVRRYEARSFLDLGCGFGDTYELLKGEELRYAGIDITPSFIKAAQERYPDTDFEISKIQEIPYPDRSFDVASCRCVLEHLPDPDPAIREMARVSTKVIVIVWFKWPGDSDRLRYDRRGFWENAYSWDRILEVADSVGLKLVDELTVKHHLVWTLEKQ